MNEQSEQHIDTPDSFVDPIKDAISRMQTGEPFTIEEFVDCAKSTHADFYKSPPAQLSASFGFGAVGIQADHSHYFNGFALLKPMRRGTAVVLSRSEHGKIRLLEQHSDEPVEIRLGEASDTESLAAKIIRAILAEMYDNELPRIDITLVTTVPLELESSYLSSVGVAFSNALDQYLKKRREEGDFFRGVKAALERIVPYSVSVAYVITAATDAPDPFVLVDTETLEYLSLESGGKAGPGWVLIDTSTGTFQTTRSDRMDWTNEIMSKLLQTEFKGLTSLRDLEHRDLETAASMIPRKMRPGLRYLVAENRRVQRLVAAIQNEDWQLMGALLLMSHATRRNDWSITTSIQNFVVDEAERFSIEGVYGATQTDEGSFVLIAGQPIRLPAFLDHLKSSWPVREEEGPKTFII